MVLKRSQQKLKSHPDAEKLLERLQYEYDTLVHKINEYYAVRKQVFALKKQQLVEDVENSEPMKQYQVLKQRLADQQRSWQLFTANIA